MTKVAEKEKYLSVEGDVGGRGLRACGEIRPCRKQDGTLVYRFWGSNADGQTEYMQFIPFGDIEQTVEGLLKHCLIRINPDKVEMKEPIQLNWYYILFEYGLNHIISVESGNKYSAIESNRNAAARAKSEEEFLKILQEPKPRPDWRVEPIRFNLIRSAYYGPKVLMDDYEYAHEHDCTVEHWQELKINLPVGDYLFNFVLKVTRDECVPVTIWLEKSGEWHVNAMFSHRWNDHQKWWLDDINPAKIPPVGTIFANGEDVATSPETVVAKETAEKNVAEKRASRREFFEKAVSEAVTAGITEKRCFGIIKRTNVSTLVAVTKIINLGIDKNRAGRIALKARSWKYLEDCLGIGKEVFQVARLFDNVVLALGEYAKL